MRKIEVHSRGKGYPIYVGEDIISQLSQFFNTDIKSLIICDENVPKHLIQIITNQLKDYYVVALHGGEKNKNLTTYEFLCKQAMQFELNRNNQIITIGGGVIGDLGGFVASTYMRGIKWINIPSTALAQIDSSIGGKVGIDFQGTKNLIGSFYNPSCVIVDHCFLRSLPQRQINNGLVEALKVGILYNHDILNAFEHNFMEQLDEIIYFSLLAKKNIVESDFNEAGPRRMLNFGHTVGHAIESYFKLDTYLHGECVANGMVYFINDEELLKRVIKIYQKLNIPYISDYDLDKIINSIRLDKKAVNDNINICFIDDNGTPQLENMPFEKLIKILKEDKHGQFAW